MKISSLPLAPSLDGTETFPLVKGSATMRGAIGAYVAAAMAPSLTLMEGLNGPAYASTALGLAATSNGQFFAVANGDGTVSIYENAAGAAVLQRTLAGTAALALGTGAGLVGWMWGNTFAAGTVGAKLAQMPISPFDHGAKADAWQFTGGVISAAALTQLVLPAAGWLASAVAVGNPICVVGAGAGGVPLVTTIAGVSGTTITLATPAAQAVAAAIGDFGTDDTAAVQAAITAAEAIGGEIDFGGAAHTFYLAAAPYVYGTWAGGIFNRGVLQLSAGITLRGAGATLLLSGGRTNPGGIFFNAYWASTTALVGMRFSGLVLDCNIAAQYVAPLPANFSDADVWQWGHAICIYGFRGLRVERCTIRGPRGNGIDVSSNFGPDGTYYPSYDLQVFGTEFIDCFMCGVQADCIGIDIEGNTFRGDYYWVGGIDIETGDPTTDQMRSIRIVGNRFDFRDGRSAVELTTNWATNSAEAAAARIHLRRAITGGDWTVGYPGKVWNGHLQAIEISGNTIDQGTIVVGGFADVWIHNNSLNITAETITGTVHLIGYPAINVLGGVDGNTAIGLAGVKIEANRVDSALPGYGIYVRNYAGMTVGGNLVKNTGLAGIRIEVSSGHIVDNEITNVGSTTSGTPSDAAGIAVYGMGTSPLRIAGNHVIDTRGTEALLRLAVWAAVAITPICRITENVSSGFTPLLTNTDGTWAETPAAGGDGIWSPAGNAYSTGNIVDTGEAQIWSMPQAAKFGAALGVMGALTVGDTSGAYDGIVTINRGTAGAGKLFWTDGAGIEYQVAQPGGGGLVMQNFAGGVYQWTDLAFSSTGKMLINLTWGKPLFGLGANTYLWICNTVGTDSSGAATAVGQCRKKIGGAPTSDTDGTAGWN